MFPSPSGELGIARFFAGEGLQRALFEAGLELESRAGRVAEPYQSARLQLASHCSTQRRQTAFAAPPDERSATRGSALRRLT